MLDAVRGYARLADMTVPRIPVWHMRAETRIPESSADSSLGLTMRCDSLSVATIPHPRCWRSPPQTPRSSYTWKCFGGYSYRQPYQREAGRTRPTAQGTNLPLIHYNHSHACAFTSASAALIASRRYQASLPVSPSTNRIGCRSRRSTYRSNSAV